MKWSNEKIIQLIELYRQRDVLWNPLSKYYMDRLKKNNAWEEIAAEMEGNTEEIKKKIESLLSSYRRERAKVKKSHCTEKGADDIYEPSWFAYKCFSFLNERNISRKRQCTMAKKATKECDQQMEKALQILPDTASNDDECETFGAFVGKKLKKADSGCYEAVYAAIPHNLTQPLSYPTHALITPTVIPPSHVWSQPSTSTAPPVHSIHPHQLPDTPQNLIKIEPRQLSPSDICPQSSTSRDKSPHSVSHFSSHTPSNHSYTSNSDSQMSN